MLYGTYCTGQLAQNWYRTIITLSSVLLNIFYALNTFLGKNMEFSEFVKWFCKFECSRYSNIKQISKLKKVCKNFEINLAYYHDLYIQSDTLLLADVFENFRNECIEIYELDLGLAWQACLNKTEVELELLTDIDMLLMVKKGKALAEEHVMYYIDIQQKIMNRWKIITKIKNHYISCT